MPRPVVVVCGDINVDLLARVDAFGGLGGDYLVPALEMHCGGVGANTAIALAHWGARVRLLGAAGQDWFSQFVLGHLRRRGVDVSCVQQTPRALTGLMLVVISRGEERTFFGSRGANARFHPSPANRRCLEGAQALHVVGYNFLSRSAGRAALALLAQARGLGISVSLDVGMAPAKAVPRTILQVARRADILFLSDEEAATLTGHRDTGKALKALEQLGVRRVVVKLGRRGCLFREGGRLRQAPAFKVAGVDSTGCGDAFTAAFLQAVLRGWPLEEAALAANAAGAAAATVLGAGEQLPGPRRILRLAVASRLAPAWEPVRLALVRRLRTDWGPRRAVR